MQALINGFVNGLAIALLAIAFNAVYLPTHVFAIAIGGIYAAVPFITWQILRWAPHWPAAVFTGLVIGMAMSALMELLNHWPLERRRASGSVHLLTSIGISIVIVSAIVLIWGNDTKTFRQEAGAVFFWHGILIADSQLLIVLVSLSVLLLFHLWLRYSSLGLLFRALADNPVALALQGYNIRRLRLLAFAMSGVLCSVSSLLVAYDVGFDPHVGLSAVLLAIVAVIVGGRTLLIGPVLGGVILGCLRGQVIWYLSAPWQEAVTFAILVLFLFLRPQGIAARRESVLA